MELKHVDLAFEIKEVSPEGKFSGMASVYDLVDYGGDVVRPGAFSKTVQEQKTVPILLQHSSRMPIGLGTLKEVQGGLMIEGQMDMDDPDAVKTFNKMKLKILKGLSIGFTTIKDNILNSGIRELLEVKLWEVSVVLFPMNPAAQVVATKDLPLPDAAAGRKSEPDLHSAFVDFRLPEQFR